MTGKHSPSNLSPRRVDVIPAALAFRSTKNAERQCPKYVRFNNLQTSQDITTSIYAKIVSYLKSVKDWEEHLPAKVLPCSKTMEAAKAS